MSSDLLTPNVSKRTSDMNYRANVKAKQLSQRLAEAALAIIKTRDPVAAKLCVADVEYIIFNSGGICAWCGKKLPNHGSHFDHIWPYILGGQNTADNIALCCPRCNRRKQDKSPIQWMQKIFSETHILTPLIERLAFQYQIELHHTLSMDAELLDQKAIEIITAASGSKKRNNKVA